MPTMKNQSGMSILEILIGLGLLALVMPLGMKLMHRSNQTGLQTENRMDLQNVARSLLNQVDCPNLPTTCTNGSLLALPKKKGGTLVSNSGKTVMSGWTLRVLCTGGNQFQVQVAKYTPAGKIQNDPITQQPLDFNHPRATLFPEKTLCTSQEPPPTPDPAALMDVVTGESCMVDGVSQLPCNAPAPPDCPTGYLSVGVSLDAWGGDDDTDLSNIFGQRWVRYCSKTPL